MRLPSDHAERKALPMYTALFDYFPAALVEVVKVVVAGNRQHNGDSPVLYWDRSKSADHFDCAIRHMAGHGTFDSDGTRHLAKAAWRLLAALQLECEGNGAPIAPAALRAPKVAIPGTVVPHRIAMEMARDGVVPAEDDEGEPVGREHAA